MMQTSFRKRGVLGPAAYLLSSVSGTFQGVDNAEVDRRDAELDSGEVAAISHDEFVRQVGRA